MSIPRKFVGIGNHHADLAAIASAMGPEWSAGEERGMHHLTDGTALLVVSWHTQTSVCASGGPTASTASWTRPQH